MSKINQEDSEEFTEQAEFFASAVHELRTPLTAIHGYSEALSRGTPTPEEITSFSTIIHRNSAYLLRLVNSLLDLEKLRAGKFELERKPFNLFAMCEEVEEICRPRAEEKEISFGIEPIYPLPRKITGDTLRLKQVLLNLATNAVKFTKKGGVKIVLSFDVSDQVLMFKVIDTGIGLTSDQQNRLFSAFSQVDPTVARNFGGTGLGLMVSKQIVTAMGGSIQVSSEPDQGSVFSIRLPVDQGAVAELQMTPPETRVRSASKGRIPALMGRVLIIEDTADTRNLVKYLLEKTGAHVSTAENGKIGLDQALQGEYDLVLLDRHLPILDGGEVARRLREANYTGSIIAFSAERGKKSSKWITEHGLSGSVPKPFSHADIYRVARKYLTTVSNVLESEAPLHSTLLEQSDEYQAIVNHFIESLPRRLEDIRSAVNKTDSQAVVTAAHKLCAASIFGFPLLEDVARSLETAAKEGSIGKFPVLFTKLEGITIRITKAAEDHT